MFFKPYYLGCLAHASYLIGGDNGDAAVIDPRRDVDEYLADAEAEGLTIKHVIETHLHADFVSGHVELAKRTGATIALGGATPVDFPHRTVREGDEIVLGDVRLRFLETPGHTPEGVSILAFVGGEAEPRMVFTGDTLFIGDVGRPDLAGWRGHSAEAMAHAMYHTLKEKLLTLPDATEVWPAHGAGSACGRALSDERVSTMGREKMLDPALRPVLDGDEEAFVRALMEGQTGDPAVLPARRDGEPPGGGDDGGGAGAWAGDDAARGGGALERAGRWCWTRACPTSSARGTSLARSTSGWTASSPRGWATSSTPTPP